MNFSSFVVLAGCMLGTAYAGNKSISTEQKSTTKPVVLGQKHVPAPAAKNTPRPPVQLETYEDLLKQQTPQLDDLPSSDQYTDEEAIKITNEFERQRVGELKKELEDLELEKKKKKTIP
jgi:hypothetical protein